VRKGEGRVETNFYSYSLYSLRGQGLGGKKEKKERGKKKEEKG